MLAVDDTLEMPYNDGEIGAQASIGQTNEYNMCKILNVRNFLDMFLHDGSVMQVIAWRYRRLGLPGDKVKVVFVAKEENHVVEMHNESTHPTSGTPVFFQCGIRR